MKMEKDTYGAFEGEASANVDSEPLLPMEVLDPVSLRKRQWRFVRKLHAWIDI